MYLFLSRKTSNVFPACWPADPECVEGDENAAEQVSEGQRRHHEVETLRKGICKIASIIWLYPKLLQVHLFPECVGAPDDVDEDAVAEDDEDGQDVDGGVPPAPVAGL